ncbi:fimbrial protein, partial [Salmonella enterica]|nr:fimbrial protein [Salmonella enterica]
MKKTLIALAVAASAVVSGSATAAWSTGGDF